MHRCEIWTIEKAECQIDAFELWCSRRLLRVPWSNQSILKEISPEYSLEGPVLKLTLQYFGHLMWRANSLEKTLLLGKIEGRRKGLLETSRNIPILSSQPPFGGRKTTMFFLSLQMCLVGTNLNQFKMLLLKTVQRNGRCCRIRKRVASGPPRPELALCLCLFWH